MARPMVPQEAGSVFKKTKATWKLTKAARNRILELVVDGFSYSEAAEFVKREMKITVCKETVKYQVSKNLDFVLQQRNQAYEWALLEFQQIMAGHDESPDAWNMDLKAVVEEVIREDKIVRELAKLVGWTD